MTDDSDHGDTPIGDPLDWFFQLPDNAVISISMPAFGAGRSLIGLGFCGSPHS